MIGALVPTKLALSLLLVTFIRKMTSKECGTSDSPVNCNSIGKLFKPLTPFLYKYQKKLADYPTSPLSSPPLVMCVIYFTSGTVKLSDLLSPGAAVLSSADSQQKQKGPKEERGTKNKAFITGWRRGEYGNAGSRLKTKWHTFESMSDQSFWFMSQNTKIFYANHEENKFSEDQTENVV